MGTFSATLVKRYAFLLQNYIRRDVRNTLVNYCASSDRGMEGAFGFGRIQAIHPAIPADPRFVVGRS